MIDPTRREVLQALERLSELTPDVRFGQLIANLSYLALGPTNEAVWEMEDNQLLEAIRQHTSDLSRRQQASRDQSVARAHAESGIRSSHPMLHDSVVDEVRAAREAYAKRFNYDLELIRRDLREQAEKSGVKLVTLSPRRISVGGHRMRPRRSSTLLTLRITVWPLFTARTSWATASATFLKITRTDGSSGISFMDG